MVQNNILLCLHIYYYWMFHKKKSLWILSPLLFDLQLCQWGSHIYKPNYKCPFSTWHRQLACFITNTVEIQCLFKRECFAKIKKKKKKVKGIWVYVRWSAFEMWHIALLVGCLQLLKQMKRKHLNFTNAIVVKV